MKPTFAAGLIVAVVSLAGNAGASVVISEVHFHPETPDGRRLEFVELHNPTAGTVDLSGWELRQGIEFTFAAGTTLDPGAYLVVARNRDALRERFGLPEDGVYGDYTGSLENSGEAVLLRDAFRAYVDRVVYSDREPWPTAADGDGHSLQKLCVEPAPPGDDPGPDHLGWVSGAPTPLEAARRRECPPPAFVPPAVVINEIHYHPARPEGILEVGDDGESAEYIELHNPGDVPVNIGGWALTRGVDFEFPSPTAIAPGGYVLVGRNADALRERFALDDALFVGEYDGRLANSGERVTLSDASGRLVDSVPYGDGGDWSYAADGEGHSLERIAATAPGEDPANWSASTIVRGTFQRLSVVGPSGPGLAQRFILTLGGTGEVVVDDVVLEDVRFPGVNLLANGDFEVGLDGWNPAGNARSSVWDATAGVGGSGALRLIAEGPCPFDECGSSNGVWAPPTTRLTNDTTYRLTMSIRFVRGHLGFSGGLFRGVQATPRFPTPGARNSVASDAMLPFVDHVGRFPREPTSTDATWMTAHVRSAGTPTVALNYSLGEDGDVTQLEMVDDGLHRDGAAGDGVFGQQLPPFPHNTQVRYWITATDGDRSRDFPHLRAPGQPQSVELGGYYVSDLPKDSPLPIYHVLIEGVNGDDWKAVNDYLNCDVLRRASFAFRGDLYPDVGLRWRGNTACVIDKRNFKLRFNRARFFRGQRKINLNSQWTDKALVREHLAWEFIDEIGAPAVATEYVRVNVSGSFYGLYVCLEHPDQRFLDRIGLDPDGNLYKAKQPPVADPDAGVGLQSPGKYSQAWEEETNEGSTFADVEEFVSAMHADAATPEGPSIEFWEDRTIPEMVIGFQISQIALNNFDSALKNHFLYHDLDSDRWGFITWDMDLVMGKYFTPDAVDRQQGRQVGTLNDLMVGDVGAAPRIGPWFFTNLFGNSRWNYLVDYFFHAGGDFFHRAYLVRLWNILEEKYSPRGFDPRIDRLVELIFEEQMEDFERWGRYPSNVTGFPDDMLSNVDIVREQIREQHGFLQQAIRNLHPMIPAQPKLVISEILYLPQDNDHDLEFLELVNTTAAEVDLAGWTIDGIGFRFPEGAVAPPGAVIIVARSPERFFERHPSADVPLVFGPYGGKLANEGELIRVLDAGVSAGGVQDGKQGYPATIDHLAYESDGEWPEVPPGHSLQLVRVAGDVDNDRPEAWTVSPNVGGGPGQTAPEFVRGDVTGDEAVNITDAINVLAHLFQGGGSPPCLDAADVNDDGEVNLTDAVALLNHLFRGQAGPPPPYPERGVDTTPDELSCGG